MTSRGDGWDLPRPPVSVIAARVIVWLQVAVCAAGALFGLGVGLTALRSDRQAERAGHPNEFHGLGEGLGFGLAAVATIATVLLLVPLLMFREGRPGTRVALIVVECVPVVASIPVISRVGPRAALVIVPSLAIIGLLATRSASEWSRTSPD